MGNENASHAAPCEGLQCEDLIFFLLMGLADHHRIAGIVQYGFRRTDDNAEEIPVDPGDDDAYNGSLAAPEVRSDDIPFISKFLGLILYRLPGGFFYVWIP